MADDPVFRIPSPLLDLHSASANDIYRSTLEIRIYDAIENEQWGKSPCKVKFHFRFYNFKGGLSYQISMTRF